MTKLGHGDVSNEIRFWLCSTLFFLIIFSTNNLILERLGLNQNLNIYGHRISTVREIIAPIRGGMFLLTLVALLQPLLQDLRNGYRQVTWPSPRVAVSTFVAIGLLLVPQGLRGLGQEYGSQSVLMFEKVGNVTSFQRFLMPALGYITFLRGSIFFFVLSLVCTFGLIYLSHTWLVNNGINLPAWGVVSILTSSFVAAQYQIPGYPDVLVFIFLILTVTIPLSDLSKLSFIVLSISAHEASIILYWILSFFIFNRRTAAKLYGIFCIYGVLWLGSEGFSLTALMLHRPQPSATVHMSSVEWALNNPARELLGIFFAYKALWLLIAWGIILLVKKKDFKSALQIIAILASSVFMTFLAIDTSRLMGWGFYALLLSMRVIYERKDIMLQRITNAILLVNLLIPSAYVGLNLGMLLPPGLYSQLRYLKNWFLSVMFH